MESYMKMMLLKGNSNMVEKMADAMVDVLEFSNQEVVYPEFTEVKEGDGVEPEWFYDAYNGVNGFSEMSAIHQYITQQSLFEPVSNVLLGAALVEMKHLDKLGDLITKLGGKITSKYDTSKVKYGETPYEALNLAIKAEEDTLKNYRELRQKLTLINTRTSAVCVQLLSKLISDEEKHVSLFQGRLVELAQPENG